ncbi:uncharacterized protein [Bemisia tabaci]|uniref:uncharacterized protein n=1 Tax=Bemisia tabaci TaxID=7038 RepID=UPI0008F9C1F4|nr:PREDICTED: cytochrome c oxidase assembly factor 4 homolog, mitochondrial [Bemisia tabaci]
MSDEDHEDSDPVEKMLKQAGCLELHYKIQMCIADTKDWRKCQNEVKDFKECMEKYQKNLRKEQ